MQTVRLLLALALAASLSAHAAPGDLDPLSINFLGNYVAATAVQPDGKTILVGRFTSVLGVPRQNVARLNADGTLDMGFDPSPGGYVRCVVVQPDGKILLGGNFPTLKPNGAPTATARLHIARVNADGTLDMGFDPNPNGEVQDMAMQADGKVLLGGSFFGLKPNGAPTGTQRFFVARVNADGTLDTGFDPRTSGTVTSMAVQADGKVVIGGAFSTLQPNGAPTATARQRIARVNVDGSLDEGFDPKAGNTVLSVAVQADGKVLLGGVFTTLQPNGSPTATARQRIARVNADGSLDADFDPRANNDVYGITLQTDGKLVIGGIFTTLQPNGAASAAARQRIARLHADGTLDAGFDPKANNLSYGATLQADGKMLITGTFTTLQPNGAASPVTRVFIARLQNDPATQTLSAPDATQVLWTRSGAGPELTWVTFELSTDGGNNWMPLGPGTRIGSTADWKLTGLDLPAIGSIRARGATAGGGSNASSGLIEQAVPFEFVTEPPVLISPADNMATKSPVTVSYFLPESAGPDGATLHFGTTILHLTETGEGMHTFTFDPANPAASQGIASVVNGPIADGTYAVTLSYRDTLRSPVATDVNTNILVDTTAPAVIVPADISVPATRTDGAVVTFQIDATESGNLQTLEAVPPSGSIFPIGTTTVMVTATDGAGNVGQAAFAVTVRPLSVLADDAVANTTGSARLYPLANDAAPGSIVWVSDDAIIIDGRALIVPAGYTSTFTYAVSDGELSGGASVTVSAGTPVGGATKWQGLLYDEDGKVAGWVSAARTRARILVTLKLGTETARASFEAAGSMGVGTSLGMLGGSLAANGRVLISLVRDRRTYTASARPARRNVVAEKHHIALAGADPAQVPGGGAMRTAVFATGSIVVACKLPDGRDVAGNARVLDNGSFVFYKAIGGTSPGAVIGGELILADLAATDVTGELEWNLPAQSGGLHSAGLATTLTANGSLYAPGNALPGGPVQIELSGGDLDSPLAIGTTASAGKPANTAAVFTWIVSTSKGTFSTSIKDPARALPITGAGIYLPKSNRAWGFFPGTTVGGRIEMTVP